MFHDAVVNDQVWDVVIHTGKVKSDERNSKRPGRAVVYARKSQHEEVLHNNIQTDSISVEQHLQMAENQ